MKCLALFFLKQRYLSLFLEAHALFRDSIKSQQLPHIPDELKILSDCKMSLCHRNYLNNALQYFFTVVQ
jgi:hypothetical protein